MAQSKFSESLQAQLRAIRDSKPKNGIIEPSALSPQSSETNTSTSIIPSNSAKASSAPLSAAFKIILDDPCAETLKLITKPEQTPEIVNAVIQADGIALKDVAKRLVTADLCQIAVQQNGLALACIVEKYPDKLSDEMIYEAVKNDGLAIEYVPRDKITKELAQIAIQQPLKEGSAPYKYPIAYIPPSLLDYPMVTESIKKAPLSLRYVPRELMTKALMLRAVTDDGRALGGIPEEYRTKDLVKIAMAFNPFMIQFVPIQLRTKTICEKAFQEDPFILKWIPSKFITSEMCLTVIAASDPEDVSKRFEINWIPESLRDDNTILDALIKKYGVRYILEWNNRVIDRIKKKDRRTIQEKPLPQSMLSHIYDVIATEYHKDPLIIQLLPERVITKEMCLAAIQASDPEHSYQGLHIEWIPKSLWNEKEILDALIEKYGEDYINNWNDGILVKHSAFVPQFQIAEAETPLFDTTLVPLERNDIQLYELAKHGGVSVLRNYYISDIHIEHQLQDLLKKQNATYQELYDAIDAKIQEMMSGIEFDNTTGYLLVGGDVGHSKELVSLFYERLKRFWHRSVIAVLGNHELWDDHPEGAAFGYISRPIRSIISDYKAFFDNTQSNYPTWARGIFLLQNALYLNYKNEQHKTIEERRLLSCSEEDLRDMCSKSAFIVLGGIGFSGLNQAFNASNGSYRAAVTSLEKDRKLSEQFEAIHEKLRRCAGDMQVIVLTHTPVSDWLSTAVNPNWIYINGHTHRNSIIRKQDGTTVLSDSQVGYTPQKWKLNCFTICGWYDPFKEMKNGIYKITSAQYQEFNQGRGIACSGCNYPGTIFMLKKNEMYMFVLQSKNSLCLLVGGQRNRLARNNLQYYYDKIDEYTQKVTDATRPFQNALIAISKEVKQIGGIGKIHGCIVDIDWYNHIYLNPFDGQITPYFAHDISSRIAYPNLLTLIRKKLPQLEEKVIRMRHRGLIPILTQYAEAIEEGKKMSLVTVPQLVLGTEIYKPSLVMKKIQYIFENNVIRIWNDEILSTDFKSLADKTET